MKSCHSNILPGKSKLLFPLLYLVISALFVTGCKEKKKPEEKVIVKQPQQMDEIVKGLIQKYIEYAASNNNRVDDSTILFQLSAISNFYIQKNYTPLWSSSQKWLSKGDTLFNFIRNIKYYGMFPSDYHYNRLLNIRNLFKQDFWEEKETRNASEWAIADLLLSDAIISVFHDVKMGRLPADSITLRKDSIMNPDLVTAKFYEIISGSSPDSVIATLEPVHPGYRDLRIALKSFIDKADFNRIDTITFPNGDRFELNRQVIQRLFGLGYIDSSGLNADSVQLSKILKNYQNEKSITADGKIGPQTVTMLNLSDEEKFKRIAITLDRYKMLPEKMPEKYVWVNIPSYSLRLFSNDTLILASKVVVGKPITRTPVLSSSISEMITYPQWTIPQSIIVKEILPGLKKDTAYLSKKGYSLLDKENMEVDPATVDWMKYTKGIPYKVVQGSGDENALGVLKFNFNNKYSVYLHDTNQRSFFQRDSRALSHGCVRVQEWEKMAYYIMNNETSAATNKIKILPVDSLSRWLLVKEKHSIPLKARIPVFIRYFTCEVSNGQIKFYEDVYNEDKDLAVQLFANKKSVE